MRSFGRAYTMVRAQDLHKHADRAFCVEGGYWKGEAGYKDEDEHRLFPAKIAEVDQKHEFGNSRRSDKQPGLHLSRPL